MKRLFATSLAILLAAPPFASPAPQQGATPTPLSVSHAPVGCMVAGTNPQIEAAITPDGETQTTRVYFKSALGDKFYYVEMVPTGGRYLAALPKPESAAGSVTYYVEGVARDCGLGKTPEQNSIVVEVLQDCRDKTAAVLGASEPVRVFSTDGGTALPRGFSGISSVVASSSGPCVPPLAPTQAGGSFLTSTAGIITMAAVAVGVTTAVIVATNDDEVASPIR